MNQSEYEFYNQRLRTIFLDKTATHTCNKAPEPVLAAEAFKLILQLQAFKASHGLDEETVEVKRGMIDIQDPGYYKHTLQQIFDTNSSPERTGTSPNPRVAVTAFEALIQLECFQKEIGPIEIPRAEGKRHLLFGSRSAPRFVQT